MSGTKLRGLSLFSGNGGIDIALEEWVETIGYCEIDRYSQHILISRMVEGSLRFAPIYSDVSRIKGAYGDCEIIFGGFPCQDISVAGAGKGLAGERSGLFYEIVRLTKEIRPSFVFLENVPAIRTRGLEQVIKAFTEVGYDCRWTCLSAASVGAPHKRERWFLLAHADSNNLRNQSDRKPERQSSPKSGNNGEKELMANSNSVRELPEQKSRQHTHDWACNSSKNVADSDSPRLSQPLQGGLEQKYSQFDNNSIRDWWSVEPDVGRVVNGTPFRVDRIKSCGNGVVPLQVKTAFRRLVGL